MNDRATESVAVTITDATDALYAALRYHVYQREAHAEYGDDDAVTQDAIKAHQSDAVRIVDALRALTDTRTAHEALQDAGRAADRRIHGN